VHVTAERGRIHRELVALRRGRGIRFLRIPEEVGPCLRQLSGITDQDGAQAIPLKLDRFLAGYLDNLPADARAAVQIGLGLDSRVDQPSYVARTRSASYSHLEMSERTIRRRVDEGVDRLAELISEHVTRGGTPPDRVATFPWRTLHLNVLLVLDLQIPEAFENRTIELGENGLKEIDLAVSVPSVNPRQPVNGGESLGVDVFRGGTLVRRRYESSDRTGITLRLPRPMGAGDRHEVALRYRSSMGIPHYGCTPRYPCESFDLHIRFGESVPSEIFRIDEGFQEDARETESAGRAVRVDGAGEVHARFTDLKPGFFYGLRWRPRAS